MAAITKIANPNLDANTAIKATQVAGELLAGEDLGMADPCYVASTGRVMRTAPQTATKVHGFPPRATKSGEAVTLYREMRVKYGSGLTPGIPVGLNATTGNAGEIDDSPSDILGFAIDASDLFLKANE